MDKIDIEKEICHGISPELAIAMRERIGVEKIKVLDIVEDLY